MNILILNGSPRAEGSTSNMIEVFSKTAQKHGHQLSIFSVCRMNIHGCRACGYCHREGNGTCLQQDDMQQIYHALNDTEMLLLASPIYFCSFSGQFKCAIDRLYAILYPSAPETLKKSVLFLSAAKPGMFTGAIFAYREYFIGQLGLQDCGIYTNQDRNSIPNVREFAAGL